MSDLDPDVRALLDAARETDAPSAADRARVREALAERIAAGAPAPSLEPLGSAPSTGAVWLGSAAGALLVAGAVWTLSAESSADRSDLSADRLDVRRDVRADGEGGARELEPFVKAPEPERSKSAPNDADGNGEDTAPEPEAPTELRTVRKASAPAGAKAPKMRSARSAEPELATEHDHLLAEAKLMATVQAALRDARWTDALEGAGLHAKRFADGMLVEERLASEALALCALGRSAEGRARFEALMALNPDTVHASRVREACAL